MNKKVFIFILLILIYILNNEFISNIIVHYLIIGYALLLNIFGFHKCKQIKKNILKCSDGNKIFYCNKNDTIISGNLRVGIPWEKYMHKYFKLYSNKNKVALDIGANIGTHSIYLSDYFSEVHSFEPQVNIYKLLKSNIKLNKCKNVKAHNYGLGNINKNEKMEKYDITQPNNQGGIGIDKTGQSNGETIIVKVLDELNINNIGLMKIDVEGYELNVLKGAIKTIRINKPVIIIELNYKTKDDHKEIKELLESLGYNLKRISFDDYICLPKNK